MSPEQARGDTVDERTDLFSFGVVLYEMTTGRLPFPGRTAAVIYDGVLNRAPAGLESVHPELERIISRCLQKEVARRYDSAADILADLKRMKVMLLQGQFANFRPPVHREPAVEPKKTASKRSDPDFGFARRWVHHLYLKGRDALGKSTPESILAAFEFYQRAIESDPNYALAHAGLADCYTLLGFTPYATMPPSDAFPRAREEARHALDLDDSLTLAHLILAQCAFLYDWDWTAAEQIFRHAIEIGSTSGASPRYLHLLCAVRGRFDEAITGARMEYESNALDVHAAAHLALVLYLSRRYDDAIRIAQKAIEIDPEYPPAHSNLAMALQATRQFEKAIQSAQKVSPSPHSKAQLAWLYGAAGRRHEAIRLRDELLQLGSHTYVSPYSLSIVYAGLGDEENWKRTIDASVEERSGLLVFLKCSTWHDTMRQSPYFAETAAKIGLV
jgi:tetratricopeptide (TPR) repeat protein